MGLGDPPQPADLPKLQQLDQLVIERLQSHVFVGFEEGALTFPPTYKYIPGQNRYDRRPEKKMRCPAWCDRVLWRVAPREPAPASGAPDACEAVAQSYYGRVEELLISDHKPVLSVFDVRVRHIDEAARARVCGDVAAAAAATRRPALVALDAPPAGGAAGAGDYAATALFDQVVAGQSFTKTLALAHRPMWGGGAGRGAAAAASFEIAGVPDWLSVTPASGEIPDGHHMPLTLVAHVRVRFAEPTHARGGRVST